MPVRVGSKSSAGGGLREKWGVSKAREDHSGKAFVSLLEELARTGGLSVAWNPSAV